MKVFVLVSGIVSGLAAVSTLICGLWIRANQVTEVSSLDFHMRSGVLSVVSIVVFIVAALVFQMKTR